jgi:AcrR family transcriptional regulator
MPAVRPYHHGNLKPVLLQAAITLIAETGPLGFTLREVARRAGVSHNAPYRHFRDKDELIAAVAEQGFERLNAAMIRAAARSTSAEDRLLSCGRGYITFALRWPQHLQVMFDLPSFRERYPGYAQAGEQAFTTLRSCVVDCQEAGVLAKGDPEPLTLLAWSIVHGVSKLAISGHLPFGLKGTIQFNRYVSETMLKGMRK